MTRQLSILVLLMLLLSCQEHAEKLYFPIMDSSEHTDIRKERYFDQDTSSRQVPGEIFNANLLAVNQFGLNDLEKGVPGVEIRIWLGHSLAIYDYLVILKTEDHRQWEARIIKFRPTKENASSWEKPFSILDSRVVKPVSGWKLFLDRLEKFRVPDILQNGKVYNQRGCGGADGPNYYFELATLNRYRLLKYCDLEEDLMQATLYLEKELGFEYIK